MNVWKELKQLQERINLISNSVSQKENKIKNLFYESLQSYYTHKIRILQLGRYNMQLLGLSSPNIYPLPLKKASLMESEKSFCYCQVQRYLFLIRNDKPFLSRLIKVLSTEEQPRIAKLFVHFFFEDISSESNPSLIDLLNIVIKNEIESNPFPLISSFLQEESFLSLIIHELLNTLDLKKYFSYGFLKFFSELEKNKAFIQLSFENMSDQPDTSEFFKIETKSSFELIDIKRQSSTVGSDLRKTYTMGTASFCSYTTRGKSKNKMDSIIEKHILDNSITEKKMRCCYAKAITEFMKQFSFKCLNIMYHNPDIYSSEGLRDVFENSNEINTDHYNDTIEHIICLVSKIIQIFNDDTMIPDVIKQIARSIVNELKERCPDIQQIGLLGYVGKFFVSGLVIPLLLNPEINGVLLDNTVLSIQSRQTLVTAIPILLKLFTFELFNSSSELLYTPFNSYLIPLMPFVMELLENIISPVIKDPFDHSLTKGNYQAFCISVPDLVILLSKVSELFNEDEMLDFKDLPNARLLFQEQCSRPDEKKEEYFLFLSDGLSPIISDKFKIKTIQSKLLDYPKESNHDYIEELTCAITNAFRIMPFNLTNETIVDVKQMFNAIHQRAMFYTDKNSIDLSHTIPLIWYTTYIVEKLPLIPKEYSDNNYQGLYDKIYQEINKIHDSLNSKKSILSYELNIELNLIQSKVNTMKAYRNQMESLATNILIEYFIHTMEIEVCFMNGIDLINFYHKSNFEPPKNIDVNSLQLKILSACLHSLKHELNTLSFDYEDNTPYKTEPNHLTSIQEFIGKFKQCTFFRENIKIDEVVPSSAYNKTAKEILDLYMKWVLEKLNISPMFKHLDDDDDKKTQYISVIHEGIQEYILSHSYNSSCVNDEMRINDINFYGFCKTYQWIDPVKHLKIPHDAISDNNYALALEFMKKMDNAKTPNEILSYFQKCTDVLTKTFKFTSNKNEIGADDLNPVYIYLMIKSKPRQMVSQFNYCQMFLTQTTILGHSGYIVTTIELIIHIITHLTCETLNVSREEFDMKCCETETGSSVISGSVINKE